MERLTRTSSGKLIRVLPSGEMRIAPIGEFSIGRYGNLSRDSLNQDDLCRLEHAIANCCSCHGSTKAAWNRINDGQSYFCTVPECINYSADHALMYLKWKNYRWERDTEYCPSDEDIGETEDRVVAKLLTIRGRRGTFVSGKMIYNHLCNLVDERKIDVEDLQSIISEIRKNWRYRISSESFYELCGHYLERIDM